MTPVYTVYNNKEIDELIKFKPKTLEELSKIKGFGSVRVDTFGTEIIDYFKEIDEKVDYNLELYKALIDERINIAKFNKLKEEDVYSNRVATYLAKMMPKNKKELKKIFGFNEKNIAIFGDYLIRFIDKYR